jgi:hypothetical protein
MLRLSFHIPDFSPILDQRFFAVEDGRTSALWNVCKIPLDFSITLNMYPNIVMCTLGTKSPQVRTIDLEAETSDSCSSGNKTGTDRVRTRKLL